jgi:hypothetical protein
LVKKVEGKVQQRVGDAKEKVQDARNALKDVVNKIRRIEGETAILKWTRSCEHSPEIAVVRWSTGRCPSAADHRVGDLFKAATVEIRAAFAARGPDQLDLPWRPLMPRNSQ